MLYFFLGKKIVPYTMLYSEYIRTVFYLFYLRGNSVLEKKSVNRKVVYIYTFSFLGGLGGGGLRVRTDVSLVFL